MPDYKLGKLPYQDDPRTLAFKKLLRLEKLPPIPETFDIQADAAVNDDFMFANDRYGDCAIAARAHQTLILEKLEQGEQIPITDQEVVDEYFQESGGEDVGLILLTSLKKWRNEGWTVGGQNYQIHAFALVDKFDHQEVRQATYLLKGIQVGLQLPEYAYQATLLFGKTFWDIEEENTDIVGGHGVYVKGVGPVKTRAADVSAVNNIGPVVKTWGMDIQMTWQFWDRYVDECWAVVDEINPWLGLDSPLDLNLMNSYLEEITGEGNIPPGPAETTINVKISGGGVISVNTIFTGGPVNLFDGESVRVRIGWTVKLTAISNEGYKFTGWGGDVAGKETEVSLWVTEEKTVEASFEEITPEPTPEPDEYQFRLSVVGPGVVIIDDDNTVKVSFSNYYPDGQSVDLLAKPNDGAHFVGFSGDILPMDAVVLRSVKMDQNRYIIATFESSVPDVPDISLLRRIWRVITKFIGRWL